MKTLSLHIGLAIIGLAWAYVVWTSDAPEEEGGDGVVVVDCTPEHLTRLTFESDRRTAVLEPRGEGDQRSWWITVTRTPENGEPTEVEFVTNEGIEEYLGSVAPLEAVRSLGEVEPDLYEELELDEEHRSTLSEVCGDHEATFYVGGSTFGTGDRYLVRADGGPVYLLSGEIVRGLENAEFQLMQRELHAFDMTEVSGLEVSASGQHKALTQRDFRNPQAAAWVDSDNPDRINELYGNWLDRLSRLRVQAYLPLDAEPGADLDDVDVAPEPVFELSWKGEDGDEIGHLEMVKLPLDRPVYYARSEATRAWVRVVATTAQQVEDDTRAVVGLPPLERPVPEGPVPPGESPGSDEPSMEGGGAGIATPPHGAMPSPHGAAPSPHGSAPSPHGAMPAPAPAVPATPAAPLHPTMAHPAPTGAE